MEGSSSCIMYFCSFFCCCFLFVHTFLQNRISILPFFNIYIYSYIHSVIVQSALGNGGRCIKLFSVYWQQSILAVGLRRYDSVHARTEGRADNATLLFALVIFGLIRSYMHLLLWLYFLLFTLYKILDQRCKNHMTAGVFVL